MVINGMATMVGTTCRASDDVSRQLGDPNEAMVRAALDYLAGRSCTAIAAIGPQSVSQRGVLADETPATSIVRREMPGAY